MEMVSLLAKMLCQNMGKLSAEFFMEKILTTIVNSIIINILKERHSPSNWGLRENRCSVGRIDAK